MSIIFGSARIDEKGKSHGGEAGDQTGKEVSTQAFYLASAGWLAFRPISVDVADGIAKVMYQACQNDHIGYDQYNRLALFRLLKKGYKIADIDVDTECDCSALIRDIIYEVTGVDLGDFNTESEPTVLAKSGLFETVFTVKSSADVRNGDILCTAKKGHTGVIVSGAPRTTKTTTSKVSTGTNTKSAKDYIKLGQEYSIKFTGKSIEVDGIVGSNTKKQMIKVLQTAMNLDYNSGLEVDGVFGKKSSTALGKHYVEYGETQYMVSALEILLYLQGLNPKGYEYPGKYGNGLVTACKAFFGDNGKKVTASEFKTIAEV